MKNRPEALAQRPTGEARPYGLSKNYNTRGENMETSKTPKLLANDAQVKIHFIADRVKTLEVGQWTAIENLESPNEQIKNEAITSLAGIYSFLGDICIQLDEVYNVLDSIDFCTENKEIGRVCE